MYNINDSKQSEGSTVNMNSRSTLSRRGVLKVCAAMLLIAFAIPVFGGAQTVHAASSGDKTKLIIYYSWGGKAKSEDTQAEIARWLSKTGMSK